jgi:hypothetical protein
VFKQRPVPRRNPSLKGKERATEHDLELGRAVSPALLLLTAPEPVASPGSPSPAFTRKPLESVSKIAFDKRARDKNRQLDLRRIVQLGYDDELKRDFDFFTLFGVSMSSIGFLPGESRDAALPVSGPLVDPGDFELGVFFNVFAAFDAGGSGMLSFAWPISGVFMCILCASLAELSVYSSRFLFGAFSDLTTAPAHGQFLARRLFVVLLSPGGLLIRYIVRRHVFVDVRPLPSIAEVAQLGEISVLALRQFRLDWTSAGPDATRISV